MKHFKIFSTLLFFAMFCNSCKKRAEFKDLNLTGQWSWASYNSGDGCFFTFGQNDEFKFSDYGDNSSYEDDRNISGSAKMKKDIICVGSHRFRIVVYPTPYTGTIFRGGTYSPANWRMTIQEGNMFTVDWGKVKSADYYRE